VKLKEMLEISVEVRLWSGKETRFEFRSEKEYPEATRIALFRSRSGGSKRSEYEAPKASIESRSAAGSRFQAVNGFMQLRYMSFR
jgi:hypothetical protein